MVETKTNENKILRDRIQGHTGQVNSIEVIKSSEGLTAHEEGCLLSASDDGMARIWDLRRNKGVILFR